MPVEFQEACAGSAHGGRSVCWYGSFPMLFLSMISRLLVFFSFLGELAWWRVLPRWKVPGRLFTSRSNFPTPSFLSTVAFGSSFKGPWLILSCHQQAPTHSQPPGFSTSISISLPPFTRTHSLHRERNRLSRTIFYEPLPDQSRTLTRLTRVDLKRM